MLLHSTRLGLEATDEIGEVAPEGIGDPAKGFQRRVAHPTLHRGQVGPVQARVEGEALLTQAEPLAALSDATAEDDLPLGDSLFGPGHPRI